MSEHDFDTAGVFDDDYLYFFGPALDERSQADADLIWRLLDLQPGLDVLDLACGHGRIARQLAERGCQVTGLDATERFLRRARAVASEQGLDIDYVQGDMRQLPWLHRFDRVVCWFTAFGYFSDQENRQVLQQVATALRPGGQLLLELNNYPVLIRGYLPAVVAARRDDDMVVDQHEFDPLTSHSRVVRMIIRDGAVRSTRFVTRLFTFPELRDWLLAAGFRAVDAYGEDGKPLSMDHRRLIVVART